VAARNEQSIIKELLEKRINLLPDYIKKQRKNRKRFLYVVAVALLLVFGVGYYTTTIVAEIEAMKAETEAASYRISLLKEQQDQQALISILEEKITYKEDLLHTLQDQNESVSLILSMLDLSLPKGVVYNSISATNESEITIDGVSETYEQVADYIYNLKSTNHFDDVFLIGTNKATYVYSESNVAVTYYTYSISCEIGGDEYED
jgi:Tfp pilus assembly protein PilN